ncbi:hypothetical protein B0H12DRAFT_410030 [Mycena haematopus]|nr:hypothetical protein B0H12DRAFT_410030 [Mycena haematopus]
MYPCTFTSSTSLPTPMQPEEDTIVELGRTRQCGAPRSRASKSLPLGTPPSSTSPTCTPSSHSSTRTSPPTIAPHQTPRPARSMDSRPRAQSRPPPLPDVPDTARYTRLTYLPFLLQTLAREMTEWPRFRASITPLPPPPQCAHLLLQPHKSPNRNKLSHADIALTLATLSGLYTPLLRAADMQSVLRSRRRPRISRLGALGREDSRRRPRDLSRPRHTQRKQRRRRGVLVPGRRRGDRGAGTRGVGVGCGGGVYSGESVQRRGEYLGESGDGTQRGERRLKLPVPWSADHRVVALPSTGARGVESPARLLVRVIMRAIIYAASYLRVRRRYSNLHIGTGRVILPTYLPTTHCTYDVQHK